MSLLRGCVFIFFISVTAKLRLKPNILLSGNRCMWDGKNGTCISYWTCLTNAVDDVLYKTHPSVCATMENGETYTCCTGCDLVANISQIVIIRNIALILEKTGRKSNDHCIRYMLENVYPCYHVLGLKDIDKRFDEFLQCYTTGRLGRYPRTVDTNRTANRGEFPHMALLGHGEIQETAQWLCGGSVISEWYILTAGNCGVVFRTLKVQFAALGILKRSDPPSMWQVYRVAQFIPHPEYKPTSSYNDIGLIRTDRQIKFSSAVLPACLPQEDPNFLLDTVTASAWGLIDHQQPALSDVLLKVWLRPYDEGLCYEYFGQGRTLTGGFNATKQLCYGELFGDRDNCEAYSGGPLQVNACPHIIIGVSSTGHPCGISGGAGLYTRVIYYVPWIESIVWG